MVGLDLASEEEAKYTVYFARQSTKCYLKCARNVLNWNRMFAVGEKNPESLGGATRGGGTAEGGRRKLVM